MEAIADIGSILEVIPQEQIWIKYSAESCEYRLDCSPFRMRVAGMIEEGETLIGVFGPVVGGAPRYQGLIASVLVRLDGADWKRAGFSQANFKVGPERVRRISEFDFRDPRGTEIEGFPVIGRFGQVKVLTPELNLTKD